MLPLFGTRPIATAEGFAPVEAIHEILVDAGFATERGVHAVVYVAAFVLGYLRIDLGRLAPPPAIPAAPMSPGSAPSTSEPRSSARACWPRTGTRSSSAASTW